MLYTLWNNREKSDGQRIVHLFDDDRNQIAAFPINSPTTTTAITVGETKWQINGNKTQLEAQLPNDERFVANTDRKPFGRTKSITIDLAGKPVLAINEGRADWVYVDAEDNKLGQFSGGNNGVRKAITEFESDAQLSHDQKIFLSWVTRTTLEAKTMMGTLILTLSLLLVIPMVILGLM